MKKCIKSLAIALASITLLGSCADEKIGAGDACLNLGVRISDDATVVSKASVSPAENCIIYLYSAKGLIRKYNKVADVPSDLWLASGNYHVETWAGDSADASWTEKYYRGGVDFTLSSGDKKRVDVNCKIANTVVSVKFPENIDEYLKDYSITVEGESNASLVFNTENLGAKGYYMLPADGSGSLLWTIKGKTLLDEDFSQSGVITDAKRTTEYVMNITKKEDDFVLGGVMFDVEVDVEPIETIVDDFVIAMPPRILLGGELNIDEPITVEAMSLDRLNVYVAGSTKMESVIIKGDFFQSVCDLPYNEFNFFAMTSASKENFAELGVEQTYTYDEEADESLTKISFRKLLLDKIRNDGEYQIKITAKDVEGRENSKTVRLIITADYVTTTQINLEDVYAFRATIRGHLVKDGATNPEMLYRESGNQEWIKATTAIEDRVLIAKLEDLKPGTTYEYVASCDQALAEDIETFTTEETAQLPNSSFEIWDTSSTAYTPYAKGATGFWDTGNWGSTTLGASYNISTPDKQYVHDGEYSVKMASRNIIIKFAAGNIFIGKYLTTAGTNGILGFGQPWKTRPTKLRGWVRYVPGSFQYNKSAVPAALNPGDYDEGQIYVAFAEDNEMSTNYNNKAYKWNPQIIRTGGGDTEVLFDPTASHIIAYGDIIFKSATEGDGLVQFEIPITYNSNKVPSYVILTATASRFGDYFAGGASTMWLDDLEFVYE